MGFNFIVELMFVQCYSFIASWYRSSFVVRDSVLFATDTTNAVDTITDSATRLYYKPFDIGATMIYIVFTTEACIGHVFSELQHALDFISKGIKWHRLEVWNKDKNRLSGLHYR